MYLIKIQNRKMADLTTQSEEFYQSLQLPYQVVSIVSGALNNAAAKKYDLEVKIPFSVYTNVR